MVEDVVLRKKQKTDGMHKLSSPSEGPFLVKAVTDQVPIGYATWMKEMFQIPGTSIFLGVSTLEGSPFKDVSFIFDYSIKFFLMFPILLSLCFFLSNSVSMYNILKMTRQLFLKQMPEQTR